MLASPVHIIAPGFVGALAVIGALSHGGTGPSPRGDFISGEFQARYETRFIDANPLQSFAVGALASIRYAALSEAYDGAVVGDDGWLFTSEELEVHANFAANVEASARRIAEVRNELAARDIRLITVIIPDKADIYAEHLGFRRADVVRQRLTVFTDLLDRFGAERIDAAAHLRAAKAERAMFMRDDTHWSPFGAQIVAEVVGEKLADADLMRSDVAGNALGAVSFDGDLLSFVPTGPFRPVVGPEQRVIDRFETAVATESGLFGDAPVEVALVGTSFSARPEFHFEGCLKRALSADVLNFAVEGKGPFTPMDAFLASEEFELNPPKVVIWEIPVRYVSKEMN